MAEKKESPLPFDTSKNIEITPEQARVLYEENQKLLQQNIQLKKNLEREEFLHNKLYGEWKELKEIDNAKEAELENYREYPSHTISRKMFNWLLVVTSLLALLALYNLFFNAPGKTKSPAEITQPQTNIIKTKIEDPAPTASDLAVADSFFKKKVSVPSHQIITPALDPIKVVRTEHLPEATPDSTLSNNLYKIKSKAYLYNEPDINTRRNAFVVHWNNSYTTLKSLKDKNGFIYVVFKNNLGQTSKGWLLKSDLYPADIKVQ